MMLCVLMIATGAAATPVELKQVIYLVDKHKKTMNYRSFRNFFKPPSGLVDLVIALLFRPC